MSEPATQMDHCSIKISLPPRHGLKTGRSDLIRRKKQSVTVPLQQSSIHPQSFVFCERSSGAVRLRVEAENDGSMPVEKAAGLLAMHCLVRGQAPEDYELMVVSRESLLHLVAERAQQLLAAGRALGSGVKVSRREQEVLDGVLQHLTNKEIARNLNVSERTVKFHVSSLLAKFGVTDRMALTREVQMGRTPSNYQFGKPAPQSLFGYPVLPATVDALIAKDPASAAIPRQPPKERNRVLPMFRSERSAT
jgi:DNA-binding CsgD family transcriptional regulator